MEYASKALVRERIKQYGKNKIILAATHDMREAEEHGSRIAFISHGKINYCGSPKFFAKKFDHTLDFTFTTSMSSMNKV